MRANDRDRGGVPLQAASRHDDCREIFHREPTARYQARTRTPKRNPIDPPCPLIIETGAIRFSDDRN